MKTWLAVQYCANNHLPAFYTPYVSQSALSMRCRQNKHLLMWWVMSLLSHFDVHFAAHYPIHLWDHGWACGLQGRRKLQENDVRISSGNSKLWTLCILRAAYQPPARGVRATFWTLRPKIPSLPTPFTGVLNIYSCSFRFRGYRSILHSGVLRTEKVRANVDSTSTSQHEWVSFGPLEVTCCAECWLWSIASIVLVKYIQYCFLDCVRYLGLFRFRVCVALLGPYWTKFH